MSHQFSHKWTIENYLSLVDPQETPNSGRSTSAHPGDSAKHQFVLSANFNFKPKKTLKEKTETAPRKSLGGNVELYPFGSDASSEESLSLFINLRNTLSPSLLLHLQVSILGANGGKLYFKQATVRIKQTYPLAWKYFIKRRLLLANVEEDLVNGHLTLLTEIELLNAGTLPILSSPHPLTSESIQVLHFCTHKWAIPQFGQLFASKAANTRIQSSQFAPPTFHSVSFSVSLEFRKMCRNVTDGPSLAFTFNCVSPDQSEFTGRKVYFRVSLLNVRGQRVFSQSALQAISTTAHPVEPSCWPIISRNVTLNFAEPFHRALLDEELSVYCQVWTIEYSSE